MTPRLGTGRKDQAFTKDRPRIPCYKLRQTGATSPPSERGGETKKARAPSRRTSRTPLLGAAHTRIGTEGAAPGAGVHARSHDPKDLRGWAPRLKHCSWTRRRSRRSTSWVRSFPKARKGDS